MAHKALWLSGDVSINKVSDRKHNAVPVKFWFYSFIFSEMTDRVYVDLTSKKCSSLKKIWDTWVTCTQREESPVLVAI